MNIVLYMIIFITGLFFGSFFSLAVYRLPRKEDILIKHSYCPNCNHKLGFFDLFPVLSFVLLRGKCRYCKTKIRPRYLILELCSGVVFVLTAISMKINIYTLTLYSGLEILAVLIFISVLFIISGIDKECVAIQKNVLIFGYIFEVIYIIYQCALGNINVYQYVIYLLLLIILLIIDIIVIKRHMLNKYYMDILYLVLYIIVFTGSTIYICSTIITLILLSIYLIIRKNKNNKIPIGFILCICTIIVLVSSNFLINYSNICKL